jgi:hypothetical protein
MVKGRFGTLTTAFRAKVARSAKSLRKPWAGALSAMRPVASLAGAAGERGAQATGVLARGFSGSSVAVGVEDRGEKCAHVLRHANYDADQGRKPGVNASADAASLDKLLERMLVMPVSRRRLSG